MQGKNEITKDTEQLFNTIIPTYEEIAKELENEIDSYEKNYNRVDKIWKGIAQRNRQRCQQNDKRIKFMRSKKCIEKIWATNLRKIKEKQSHSENKIYLR